MRIAIAHRPVPAMPKHEHGIAKSLRAEGHEVQTGENFDPSVDAVLIPNQPTFYTRALKQLRGLGPRRPRVVAWMTEPLVPPLSSGLPWPRRTHRDWAKLVLHDKRVIDARSNEHRMVRLVKEGLIDAVATTTLGRVERFAEVGIDAAWVPLSIGPDMHADLRLERDIPVLFLGAMTVPRRRLLAWRIKRAGVPLMAVGGWHDARFWGDDRTRLINRSVITLNLNRFEGNFPDARFNLGASNRSLIVSEPVYRPDPYVAGETHVEAEAADLPEVLLQWLADHAARERMVDTAYEMVMTQLARARCVSSLLALLAGEPVPAH
ncbi:MAG: hypothetical protein QOH62_1868 [Solirubrobacteraceae bacterium]|jgi:hypothetical protein|nr:hypothetical protein [Solirubrobacteraceae bacterium]